MKSCGVVQWKTPDITLITDIADGEYLVAPLTGGQEYATSLSEKVPYTLGTRQGDVPARRVRIADGEAVTGVDFLFKEPPIVSLGGEQEKVATVVDRRRNVRA